MVLVVESSSEWGCREADSTFGGLIILMQYRIKAGEVERKSQEDAGEPERKGWGVEVLTRSKKGGSGSD